MLNVKKNHISHLQKLARHAFLKLFIVYNELLLFLCMIKQSIVFHLCGQLNRGFYTKSGAQPYNIDDDVRR